MALSVKNHDFSELPHDVVEEILLNVPAQNVVCVCRLVCQKWKAVVDTNAFWKELCNRKGFSPRNTSRIPTNWQTFYILCEKRRNLLKNPNAEDGFKNWKITQNGGDQWNVEGMFRAHPNEAVTKCFVTSYGKCLKQQLINLIKEGYSPAFMDELQPDIVISDWYAPRWDCGSVYEICVELLDAKKRVIKCLQPNEVTFYQWNDQQWNEMSHTFKDYGPGVRFIRFTHGGKDTQFWAGHYGIRVTNSSVEILPSA